jgi:Fe-S cluster assembly protein SufD
MKTTMTESSEYLEQFAAARPATGSNGAAWLGPVREAAIARFEDLGFPTPKDERWKFTNVAPIARTRFRPSPPASPGRETLETAAGGLRAPRLVFVNGRFDRRLSDLGGLQRGVLAGSLADALASDASWIEGHLARHASFQDHAFVALNTALFRDGAVVRVPAGAILAEPIHVCYLSVPDGREPSASHPRTLILLGAGAQAAIVETCAGVGGAPYFTNLVTELVVEDGAVLDHTKLQQESLAAYHVATLHVYQGRSSSFRAHAIDLGGSLVRNDLVSVLGGEGAESLLDGLFVLDGRQHVDDHTLLDHAKPHCSSREMYKGVLQGHSRGVFYGRILVRPDAQKTDAKQTNKNLLLSRDSLVNTMPQLEIYADDVKCTHGATIGRLDEDALFYLRSRGIAAKEARSLLTHAFMSEIVGRMKVESIREQVERLVAGRLHEGSALEAFAS